jgi:hypothetical protein
MNGIVRSKRLGRNDRLTSEASCRCLHYKYGGKLQRILIALVSAHHQCRPTFPSLTRPPSSRRRMLLSRSSSASLRSVVIPQSTAPLSCFIATWTRPDPRQINRLWCLPQVCTFRFISPRGSHHPSDIAVKAGAVPLPRVPGHEVIGEVVAVGPNENRWSVGDIVGGGWHGGHCGACSSCTRGDFITCLNQNING